MGLMMWFMAKGMRSGSKPDDKAASSLEDLQAEHRRARGGDRAPGPRLAIVGRGDAAMSTAAATLVVAVGRAPPGRRVCCGSDPARH
jgi:hypothetical protein